jgi:hypothetical protein
MTIPKRILKCRRKKYFPLLLSLPAVGENEDQENELNFGPKVTGPAG